MGLKTGKNEKKMKKQSPTIIKSDGKKRKFFLKDEEVRNNLNKWQLKLLDKALQARNSSTVQ